MVKRLLHVTLVVALLWAAACDNDEPAQPPPPPPNPTGQVPTGQLPTGQLPTGQLPTGQLPTGQLPTGQLPTGQLPTGQLPTGQLPTGQLPTGQLPPAAQTVPVTLTANSTPAGAMVQRATGEVLGTTPLVSQIQIPADQLGLPQTFTFNLAGYQPSVAQAVAVNNTITLEAALVSMGGAMPGIPGMPRNITVSGGGGGAIYDYHTTTASATVNESCVVQAMSVTVRGNHSFYGDLVVRLSGPNGQSASLASRGSSNPFRTYSIQRAIGTQAMGTWRLSVRDEAGADSGNLAGFTMNLTCM
jgi:hypothetical protein